ncbi:hypothetical protein FQN57_006592 [Myotisia sp. PD_48]|nr:hypothetical protein FQN57_006592 [Myotisia sp. PD_48]
MASAHESKYDKTLDHIANICPEENSQRARQVVNSIPQYKKVVLHVPVAIWGSLRISTGGSFSFQKLYGELSKTKCDTCGSFGEYLYLMTCRRVCFLCFTEEIEFLPLHRTDAKRKFGLRVEDLATLPSMRSIPGRYSSLGIKCPTQLTLIDHGAARQAGVALHGAPEAMGQYALKIMNEKIQQSKARNLRQPRSEDHFDGITSNPKRFIYSSATESTAKAKLEKQIEGKVSQKQKLEQHIIDEITNHPLPHVSSERLLPEVRQVSFIFSATESTLESGE